MVNSDSKLLSVAWLGESGFPYGLAAIQKTIILGDALGRAGVKFTVINRKGTLARKDQDTLAAVGEFEGIKYVYASGITYRPENFLVRNLMKLKGAFNEFLYLKNMRSKDTSLASIVSNLNFLQSLLYVIYGRVLGFPVVFLYVEMASEMKHRTGIVRKTNDYLFEKFLLGRMSGALPISELLKANFKKIAPRKPILKIPTICNFENFSIPKREVEEDYFLFCGAVAYREVIDFVLQAYKALDPSVSTKMYLIVSNGTSKQYADLDAYLTEHGLKDKTKIFANIPFSELIDLYVNASALLIPLRPTKQDAARFPHKIAEYAATGNPIITTNYGEVAYYFKDGDNALVADTYDILKFAEKLKFVMEQAEEARAIGQRGKELGIQEFSHLNYGQRLKTFLQDLLQSR
ncbi:MAG: glycosyltransferase [Flavobacteriaceae bacterium]